MQDEMHDTNISSVNADLVRNALPHVLMGQGILLPGHPESIDDP